MIVPFDNEPQAAQLAKAAREFESCNEAIGRWGLSLSAEDVQALVVGRTEALVVSDRIEFGGGVARQLVLGFAGSPFVSQDNFVETVLELQELFYEFKNESLEQIPDDDLIGKMRTLFDDVANGDLEYFAEALFDGLARQVREDIALGRQDTGPPSAQVNPFDDAADPAADNAAMHGHQLATHRYDVSKWVDEDYAPGWEGSSWLDE
jgi:hypothetical protein